MVNGRGCAVPRTAWIRCSLMGDKIDVFPPLAAAEAPDVGRLHERVSRGIPRRLLVEATEDLGGPVVETGDLGIVGPGEDSKWAKTAGRRG